MTPEEIAAEAAAKEAADNAPADEAPADDAPEDDAPAEEVAGEVPSADAIALEDALESITALAAQIAELTAEKVRLQGVNYSLLEQIAAGDTIDDLPTDADDNPAVDDNPESVDDALESHRVKE